VQTDPGTVSVAVLVGSSYVAYLNVTPEQGSEQLHGWAGSRMSHLLDDEATSVHIDASVEDHEFREALGSCVIDDYLTRVGRHPFHEIACIVSGAEHESVVVAAAPPSDWGRFGHTLEQAIASFQAR
jgi:hypothetical protein